MADGLFIKIKYGEKRTKSFRSNQELRDWVNAEREAWSWLRTARPQIQDNHLSASAVFNRQFEQLDPLYNDISNFEQYIAQGNNRDAVMEAIRSRIVGYLSSPTTSENDAGRFVLKLQKQDPVAALYAFATLHKANMQPNNASAYSGMFQALILQSKTLADFTHSKLVAHDSAVSDTLQRGDEALSSLEQKRAMLEEQLTTLQSNFSSTFTKTQQLAKENLEQQQAELKQLHTDTSSQLSDLRRAFLDQESLKTPMVFWRNKQKKHRKLALCFGIVSLLSATASVIVITYVMERYLKPITDNQGNQMMPYWEIGSVLAITMMLVWFVRILVRIFLSNLHLAKDADERRTMLSTYIAMIRGGKAFKDEDLRLILEPLFRPTADGIVKDEAMPLSFFNLLTRQQ